MASRSYNTNGSFRPMPKPVSLDIPEPRSTYSGARRREARPLPKFDDDEYRSMPRERNRDVSFGERGYDNGYGLAPYRPEVRERPMQAYREPRADMPRRRRPPPQGNNLPARRPPQGSNPPAKRRPPRRQETPIRQGLLALAGINFSFKIPPIYKHIAIMVTCLVTIIAVGAILIANAFADNALAVFVDGEHVGYIEYTAGWSSEAFHDDAIMLLQNSRGVGVNVEQTVTLEPVRASAGDIMPRTTMLSQISNHYFTYTYSAIAIYVYYWRYGIYRRELLMRSMADVESARYLLTQRFQTANTVQYGFYPDWRLVPVEIHEDENVRFNTPQDAQSVLDRRIRHYIEYTVVSGDTLHGIARAWDMTLTELTRINDISAAVGIHPGQRLWVVTQAPLLSVITIDEVSRVEVLDRYVERVYVTTLEPGRTRVRQEGSDGQHTVITRTTRRHAEVIYEEEIPGEVITPYVPMIVEIGQAR